MSKPKIERKEFRDVNVDISISDKEVRVWVCSRKKGISVFRLMAMGKVYRGVQDVMVMSG